MVDEIIKSTLTLFAVIDILGSIPIILDLRKKIGNIKSEKITIIALIIMLLFQYVGEDLLAIFGADIQSFALVGSFIILLLGLEMLLNIEIFKPNPDETRAGQSVIPIAFPLIAGAGSLTTVISLNSIYSNWAVTIGIVVNMVFVYMVLKSTGWIDRILGPGGLAILRKVFGIILLAIGIKIFKENINVSIIVQ